MALIQPKTASNPGSQGLFHIGETLTIGQIVNSKGELVDSLVLEPQGIAHLISSECITLPEDVCGFVHVLTRICNQGLLTLNIGVVDPTWGNYISTAILNFSSERRLLKKNDPFIRITYHKIDAVIDEKYADASKLPKDPNYSAGVRSRAVGDFGRHFLNIKQLVGKASKKENIKLRDALLKYLPIAAFSLAFFALMVTIGIAGVARLAGLPIQTDNNVQSQDQEDVRLLKQEISNVKEELNILKRSQLMRKPIDNVAADVKKRKSSRNDGKEQKNEP